MIDPTTPPRPVTEARDALLHEPTDSLIHRLVRAAWVAGRNDWQTSPLDNGVIAKELERRAEAAEENERLRGEVERLTADLKVFTEEPGILERMGSEYTTYWYNAYLSERRRAEADTLRQRVAELEGTLRALHGIASSHGARTGHDLSCTAADCYVLASLAIRAALTPTTDR